MKSKTKKDHANRDPITKEPGSHPLSTGAGSAAAAAAGAAIGAVVGGPVGMAVGGVAGAVVGGAAGHEAGEQMNPTTEDAYWRENYSTRPYVRAYHGYERYQPAYRYGWESRARYRGMTWDEVENRLFEGWLTARGASPLEWNEAKYPARDAWDRIDEGRFISL